MPLRMQSQTWTATLEVLGVLEGLMSAAIKSSEAIDYNYSVIRVTGLISSETVTELSSMLKLEDKALRQSRSDKLAMGKLTTQTFSITYAQHGLSYDAFIAETQTEEELSVRQRSVVIEYIGAQTNFSLGESLDKLNLSRLFPDLVFTSARCTGSHATFTGYEATSEEATTDDPYAEEISLPISFENHIINYSLSKLDANPTPFGAALSNIINEPTDLAGAPAITPATDNAPVADGSAKKRRRTGASPEETLTGEGATNPGERLQDEGNAGTTEAHDYNQVPMEQD
ncbi:hypothetical protein T492DRAFT_904727 [Pavlovales sp. CCMP2436]|nr:hypothetical protein T492DRAFT_904727 [Pavlovales sp. CCMP2436]